MTAAPVKVEPKMEVDLKPNSTPSTGGGGGGGGPQMNRGGGGGRGRRQRKFYTVILTVNIVYHLSLHLVK